MDNSPKLTLRLKALLGLLAITVMGAATYTVLPGPVVTDTISDALAIDRRVFTSRGRGYVLVERFASNRTAWAEPRKLFFESGSTLATNGVYSNLVFAVNGGRMVFRDAFSENRFLPEWWGGEQSPTVIGYTNRLTWRFIPVDSRPAIQAAIDWAEFRGGGIVYLGPGEWRSGDTNAWNIDLKPRVGIEGAGIPIGLETYEGTFGSTNSARISHSTMIHFAAGTTDDGTGNGTGVPCIRFLGSTYYTNQYYQAFTDAASEWVYYRRGGNSLRGFGIWTGWPWAWNGTNPAAAAIYINEVASTTIDNVFVGPTAGPGLYIRGGFGTAVRDSYINTPLAGGIVVVDSSDCSFENVRITTQRGSAISFTGELRTNGVTYAQTANTHRIIGGEFWNNSEELVGWVGTSTSYTNSTVVESVGVKRTGWTADASTDSIGISSRAGTDTGLPVMVRGTGIPGGLSTNITYYVRWGTQAGTNLYLCLTSGRALNGGAVVDITSSGTPGSWWLEAPSAVFHMADAQEINIEHPRLDQSFGKIITAKRVPRFKFSDLWVWELGLNQTEVRQSRKQTHIDPRVVAIELDECNAGVISGGLISGSKGNTSLTIPWDHVPVGITLTRSHDINISGMTFDRLDTAIEVDAVSSSIKTDGNLYGSTVSRAVDSSSIFVPSHKPYFDAKTNSQLVASIPTALTNIAGDFAVVMKVRIPNLDTNGFPNGRHSALFNLTTSTNTVGNGSLTNKSVSWSIYRSPSSGLTAIAGIHGGTNFNWTVPLAGDERYSADVSTLVGKDVELLIQRTNNVLQIWVEGFLRNSYTLTSQIGTGAFWGRYLVLGQIADSGQFSHSQAPIYALAYHQQGFSSEEIQLGTPWGSKGGTAPVVFYDFAGATLSGGVIDLSGRGVNGTIQQIGATAPEFGPADEMTMTAGSGMTITRTGKKSWTFASTGGGGVTNDSVTLGTHTVGNYIATLSGTSGRVTVTGSGSEGATPTVDLATSGVSAGSYTSVNITVDAYGRITTAANGSGGGSNISTNGGNTAGLPVVIQPDFTFGTTNTMTFSNLTVSGALTISQPIGSGSISNEMATDIEVAAGYQPLDADLTDLADGSLTGSKVGSGIDDDNVSFDDADNLWTATSIGQALEEMNDSINAGVPNGTGAKVHWSQLLGVPAGFADNSDDGAGGGGALNDLSDVDAATPSTNSLLVYDGANWTKTNSPTIDGTVSVTGTNYAMLFLADGSSSTNPPGVTLQAPPVVQTNYSRTLASNATPGLVSWSATSATNVVEVPVSTSAGLFGIVSDETGGSGVLVGSASPAFTGSPTAPTVSAGTSNTVLATTAFVSSAVALGATNAPGSLREALDYSTDWLTGDGISSPYYALPWFVSALASGSITYQPSTPMGGDDSVVRVAAAASYNSGITALARKDQLVVRTNSWTEFSVRPLATNNSIIIERIGWIDASGSAGTDGLFWYRNGMDVTLVARSNAVDTVSTSYQISSNVTYFARIDVRDSSGSKVADMRIWDSTPSLLTTLSVTNGMPDVSARATGHGISVYSTNNIAVNLGDYGYMRLHIPITR